MDIRAYWTQVRAIEATLEPQGIAPNGLPIYYLTSIDNPEKGSTPGQVADIAKSGEAARRLVERTHRVATEAEIFRFTENLKRQTDELAQIDIARKQQFAMPTELQTLITTAAVLVNRDAQTQNAEQKASTNKRG